MNKLYSVVQRIKLLFKNDFFLLFLIFFIFCLTRFYNLDKRIIFGWDQEQFSIQIRDIIKNHHFTLLGPRVNNDLGFFLAPYLTYLLIPFYFFAKLYPGVLIWVVVIINILFFFVSFFTLKKVFSSTHALWFLILWTINSRAQSFDVIPWWPILIPLGVILTTYFLYLVLKNPKKTLLWISLGFIEGFFINMHFQFVFIVLLVNIFLFLLYKQRKSSLKNVIMYFLAFCLTFTPLLLFDLRHNFLNTKLFFGFFLSGHNFGHKQYFSWVPVLSNFFDSFTYWSSPILMIFLYFGFFIFLWFLKKAKKAFYHLFYLCMFIIFFILIIFFSYYGQRPSEYYFMFLLPLILLILTDFFIRFNQKGFLLILFILFLFINGGRLAKNLQTNYGGFYYKERVVRYIKQTVNKKFFNISYDGVSVDHGFRYLLDYYKINPSENPNDPLIQVRIPSKKDDAIFGKYGVTIPFELKK